MTEEIKKTMTTEDLQEMLEGNCSGFCSLKYKNQDTDNNNPFTPFTDKLAKTLLEKNKAYGDSFTKSVDKYGLSVIGVRLSDKYNRIEHLITNNEFKENDESLEDTLLDMAGYSILALKYLKEHEDERQD